jgi:hypothetical protein
LGPAGAQAAEPKTASPPGVRGVLAQPFGRFSVKEFGAVGDGAADDTAAIQAAIDAAYAGGVSGNKVVVFPPGNYAISRTLRWKRGVNWEGSGVESTQVVASRFPPDAPRPMVMVAVVSTADWRVEGIRFDGANRASGLSAKDSVLGKISSCHFNSMKGFGVWLEQSGSVVEQCSFYYYTSAADRGLVLDGGSGTIVRESKFATHGIDVAVGANPTGASLIRNDFGDVGRDGPFKWEGIGVSIPLGAGGRFVLDGNYFEGSPEFPLVPLSIGTSGKGARVPAVVVTNSSIASTGTKRAVIDGVDRLVFAWNYVGSGGVEFRPAITSMVELENNYYRPAAVVRNAPRSFAVEDGSAKVSGNVEVTGAANGIVLRSADGSRWLGTMGNDGKLSWKKL